MDKLSMALTLIQNAIQNYQPFNKALYTPIIELGESKYPISYLINCVSLNEDHQVYPTQMRYSYFLNLDLSPFHYTNTETTIIQTYLFFDNINLNYILDHEEEKNTIINTLIQLTINNSCPSKRPEIIYLYDNLILTLIQLLSISAYNQNNEQITTLVNKLDMTPEELITFNIYEQQFK